MASPSRIALFVLVLALAIPSISHFAYAGSGSSYRTVLQDMGIRVPEESVGGLYKVYTVALGSVVVESTDEGYATLYVDGAGNNLNYLTAPGKPMLPYIVYTFTVNGYVDNAGVYVEPLGFRVVDLRSRLIPAPQPLAYRPDYPNELRYVPDENVYGSDQYFPGTLAEVKVYKGLLGKSIVSVKIFPAQYNPTENRLVVVDRMVIRVSYGKPTYIPFQQKSLLIITTPALKDVASSTLGNFYKDMGYSVDIVDTEYIYANFPPASNITEYPGFYNPESLKPPEEDRIKTDYVYQTLVEKYNYTLALKIISYLSDTLGNYSHVLLVGNALDVPPSFYYKYFYFFDYVGPYEGWIPTDLFYADINRDLVPDLYVGRIPFSDLKDVSYVAAKIIAWHSSSVSRSDKLFMAGGYPFGLPLMFGETALSTMVLFNDTSSFDVTLLTRTSFNYTKEDILSILQGKADALWFFMLSHGAGFAFADVLATPEFIEWEYLTSFEVLSLSPSAGVPIVSSVACTNAAWDTELVTPEFPPPSIGQAILLSPAGGIAYLGSARIAWELLGSFVVDNGMLYNYYYGATYLHRRIISTYNSYRVRGVEPSLGQVVAEGLASYVAEVMTLPDVAMFPDLADIVLSEIMKLALLGDPALKLPAPKDIAEKPRIERIESINPVGYIDALMLSYYAEGEAPLYKPNVVGVMNIVGSGTSKVKVVENRILSSPYELNYHTLINTSEIQMTDGSGVYETLFNRDRSGKVLIKFCIPGWGEIRFIATSAGLVATPDRVPMGGAVTVEGFGLDILGYVYEVQLVVAGRAITTVPVDISRGYLRWTLAMPYTAPGTHNVSIELPYKVYDEEMTVITELLSTTVVVYGETALDIGVAAPTIAEAGKTVTALVSVSLGEQPVDADITVTVVDPQGSSLEPSVEALGDGLYAIEFSVNELGDYSVIVKAAYETETTRAYGTKGFTVSVVDKLYGIGSLIESETSATRNLIAAVNQSLSAGLWNLIDSVEILNDKTVVIETKLGEVRGQLVEINDNVLKVNTTAGLLFVRLDMLEDKVSTDISTVSSNLDTMSNTLNARLESLENRVDELENSLNQATQTLQIMVGVLYAIAIALGVAAVARKR